MVRRTFLVLLAALSMVALAVSFTSAASLHPDSINDISAFTPNLIGVSANRTSPLKPAVPCLVAPPPPAVSVNAAQAFTTTAWQFETPIPIARHDFGLVGRPGDRVLYAFGGMVSQTIGLTSTERYDACSGRWDEMVPLPQPRGYAQAVEIDGLYYVVGGVDQVVTNTFNVHNSTYVYAPDLNTWTQLADLPQALGGVALATANGKLYAFGGFDSRGPGSGGVDTTYEYNPLNNVWLQRTSMLSGTRSLAGAASWHGKIYVAGGRANIADEYVSMLNTMIVYDPVADKWSAGTSMLTGAYAFGFVVAPDDGLYALGGRGQESSLYLRYDPVAARWEYLSTIYADDYRSGSSAAYSRGRLFLIGGNNQAPYTYHPMTTQSVESLRLFDDFCLSALTADRSVARPGDHIRYTIELHSGIEVIDSASVIDPLPAGTTFAGFVHNPIGAAYNSVLKRVYWTGSLDNFTAPISFTFDVTVDADVRSGRRITNTAEFNSGLNWSLDRSAVISIDYFDLSASRKSVDLVSSADGRLTYTLQLDNASTQSGTFTVTDPFPVGETYISGSLKVSSGSAQVQGNTLIWQGLLPALATYTNSSNDYQWGDSLGGGTVKGVQYNWIEISETGRGFGWYPPADKARCYPVPIPFPFSFYGQIITKTAMQIDGTMYFYYQPEGSYEVMGPDNQPIPSSTYGTDRYIALFWDDIYLPPGRMYYQVVGNSPNRRVVIEYHQVSVKAPNNVLGTPGDFELVLFESSSAILMQYKAVDFGHAETSFGAGATIGIQDNYEHGLQYSYNTPALSNEMAVLFLPPQQTYTYTAQATALSYAVSVSIDALPIMNTATISDSTGAVIQRSAVAWLVNHWVYLPVIYR
jgi:uncharacterized repeat protein (TIGR01451 family)